MTRIREAEGESERNELNRARNWRTVCKMLRLLIIHESLMFDNKVQILYASRKGGERERRK